MKTLIVSAIRCSLMFSAAVAFFLANPVRANLITNGGFETGNFAGWTLSDEFTGFVTGSVGGVAPHSGNFQAALLFAGIDQIVATTPGQSYTIDFWLALPHSDPFNFFLVEFGGVDIKLDDEDEFGYREYTFNAIVPTDKEALIFAFVDFRGSGWLLDDVSITPTIPDGGSTVSLLGFGLLGLAALRRKFS
jgi:protein with PEP-CTERM/exosortase system signal